MTSRQQTSKASTRSTSSPGSESGASLFGSPDGPQGEKSGPPPAPASHSPRPDAARAPATIGTSGPRLFGSSASDGLSWSLASKLRPRTDLLGSTMYSLTWRERVTPAGRSIPALRASALRTSGPGSTGARSGWPTPQADNFRSRSGDRKGEMGMDQIARTVGPARRTASGETLTGSSAGIPSGGQLHPVHPLWLQLGPFAAAWLSCGERATASTSHRRPSSSPPSST